MSIRRATHAGSWYSNHSLELSQQLESCLSKADTMKAPIDKARIIVSPHAGYRYCGPTMAYSYASLNLTQNVKRIFILGPSHHLYFRNEILLSKFNQLETPLGNLTIDNELNEKLIKDGKKHSNIFNYMDKDTDLDEHSLEMQYPMLLQTLNWRKISPDKVKIIPMLVSHNTKDVDMSLGKILLPYLKDEKNLFIISSDFCHWGRRFQFTGYVSDEKELEEAIEEETEIEMLTSRSKLPHHKVPIWQSIEILDKHAMKVLTESANIEKYSNWKKYLEISGNTVCGANPCSVILAIIALLKDERLIKFEWPKYSQSSKVTNVDDSSVSYASGFAKIP
ncbi:hypothetical protein TBLA_0B07740 [Henningerozyma blattae CBS 6284]|uniref:AmmeMemoRadiSam system protein B n=1 Tax=Henningerozyma blattae (strain ATCC 34711 / CBS 6284 / DSM 70876 / NBRC 10599 / NRRL Y-10934 / UCD 77-7) TaxID=1071380 RepID=I2GZN8_HENB6|nr:hypothetical protein TBLA_0B07740 [Tetrapisispora blattae CBS 6284]CCH59590.1 hypothetical protein TBLA_0B07740 [Tetrapisispora blattae CBS 6284]